MTNRSAKFAAAIIAGLLAGTVAAQAEDPAKEAADKTADTCLSKPKGPVPAGGHWYYRVDRANKRNCWYIGDAKKASPRVAVKEAAPPSEPAAPVSAPAVAPEPVSPQQTLNMRRSVADARAELTAPQARVEDLSDTQAAMPAPGAANTPRVAAPDAPPSNVTSRWPESASGGPQLAAAQPMQGSQAGNAQPSGLQQEAPQAKSNSVGLAAADTVQERPSHSMQMLLLTLAGALALAGITASLIFRFARTAQVQPEIRGDRRAIWDSVHSQRHATSLPVEDAPVWRREPAYDAPYDAPRDPRAADHPERRVTEMLSRLARSAQT